MTRLVVPERAFNGGFPEPPDDESVLIVAARHNGCSATTRVRLPGSVGPSTVRRFHCAECAGAFDAREVEEVARLRPLGAKLARQIELAAAAAAKPVEPQPQPKPKRHLTIPKLSLPKLASVDPQSRSWKLLSVLIAAALVLGIMLVLRGGDDQPTPAAAKPPAGAVESAGAAGSARAHGAANGPHNHGASGGGHGGRQRSASKPAKDTKFISESSYSLAMPGGWERIDPPAGATFAAVAADGGADATLWITQDAKLDFPTFVSQSLDQLKTLAGSARIVERVAAPTADDTIVRLAADAPAGQPTYEVTLRVSGDYRYYLATTVQPDASAEVRDGADLITGSLTPELEG